MTEEEIRRLYAIAMSYDNRKFSEANITAWWEQAERNRWGYDEAREAIHGHHARSTDFLMPAHITAIIKEEKRQPARIEELRRIEAAKPAEDPRIRAIVEAVADKLSWPMKASQNHSVPALAHECPHCRAPVGRPCTRLVTRGPHRGERLPLSSGPHPSRRELAEKADT